MGLASALAAQPAGASPATYGGPHPSYQPAPGYPPMQQQQPAGYPTQSMLGGPAYPPQPMMQQPMQQSPQQPNQGMVQVVAAKLAKIVQVNQLQAFYTPDKLQALTARVTQKVDFHALAARWRMPTELAIDLAALALYDIVIYGDDSGSMESENGERIADLELIMAKVAEVATLFDEDGIEVRFINANLQGNNIKSAADASHLLKRLEYRWDTKLAANMEHKILDPMAYRKPLSKPLLIITITDGEPSDKPQDKIIQTIQEARTRLTPRYGPCAVAFQFAQVGKDREAQEFLSTLDKHPVVGKMIDCTSYYELEQSEYAAKGISLSVEAWLVKLMVGAIDPDYDEQDESAPAASVYGAPGVHHPQQPGGYPQQPGGYPQQSGGYPQQPGGYPQQPGGYPQQPGGYPQQPGGYPQQSGGYPQQPGGYPPQPGTYPPDSGGYPPQQGGYPGQPGGYPPQAPGGYPPQQQGVYGQQQQKPKKGLLHKLFS